MKHIKCEECGKKFSHETRTRVEQALRLHMQRVHLKSTIPCHPNNGGKSEPVEQNNRAELLLEQADPPAMKRIERRGTWKRKPKSVEVSINYCPKCGCNLQAVAVGLAMNSQ